MRLLFLIVNSVLILAWGCGKKTEQPAKAISMEAFQAGPQLVKVAIHSSATVDSLIKAGVEVVVQEDAWVIVRIESSQAGTMQTGGLKMQAAAESDLVQRLVRITLKQSSDLQEVGDTGIDVWEVKGDTVIAQAFDIYIRRIEALGYPVEILQKDVRDLAKKGGGNEK